jgi:hypothetical protein
MDARPFRLFWHLHRGRGGRRGGPRHSDGTDARDLLFFVFVLSRALSESLSSDSSYPLPSTRVAVASLEVSRSFD